MDEQKLYQVALSMIPGVGNLLTKHLISYCGSAKGVFQAPRYKLGKIPGIGPKTAESILNSNQLLHLAEKELAKAEKEGARILAYTDKEYPYRLKQIPDAPTIVYFKGQAPPEAYKTVAIVGTRQPSQYGKQLCEQIVQELLPYQPLIVSGLAYGIDVIAHRTALRHGLNTLGVMASGLDIVYPSAHRNTAMEMLKQGGLLSEHPFGSQPEAFKFPARNRIIAGLVDVVIVVEAAAKGGALITADIAHSYDREVFALPGPLTSPTSAGCNQLIKRQIAHMYVSGKDLGDIMNWQEGAEAPAKEASYEGDNMSPEEATIIRLLSEHTQGLQIDELSWRSQLPLSQLASVLLNLEFRSIIRSMPGKRFALLK